MSAPLPNIGRLPDGRFVVSSVKLAEVCARRHSPVGDAIRKAKAAYPDLDAEFVETTFRSRNGRDYAAWDLGPRALVATLRFLENIPGRFDKGEVLGAYWGLFLTVGAVSPHDPLVMPEPRAAPEPDLPEPEPLDHPVVSVRDGQVFANTLDLAAFFAKRHDNVLQIVDGVISRLPEFALLNFQERQVTYGRGNTRKTYDMTRDAFTFVAMGLTGDKADEFKLRYMAEFNRMESEKRDGNVLPLLRRTARLRPIPPINRRTSRHGKEDQTRGFPPRAERPV